jgi:hypothetical protein
VNDLAGTLSAAILPQGRGYNAAKIADSAVKDWNKIYTSGTQNEAGFMERARRHIKGLYKDSYNLTNYSSKKRDAFFEAVESDADKSTAAYQNKKHKDAYSKLIESIIGDRKGSH